MFAQPPYFNPLPSYEGRPGRRSCISVIQHFNPLPSYEGRLGQEFRRAYSRDISIHSPHTRGDSTCSSVRPSALRFQSTPLTRGETRPLRQCVNPSADISIHSPHTRGDTRSWRGSMRWQNFNPLPSHEGRPAALDRQNDQTTISIHSPHTRGDAGGGTAVFCPP